MGKDYAPDVTPASATVVSPEQAKQNKIDELRTAITTSPWKELAPRGAPSPATLPKFRDDVYQALWDHKPGYEALAALLAAEPAYDSLAKTATAVAVGVGKDRKFVDAITEGLSKLRGGTDQTEVHGICLAAYAQVSSPGRHFLKTQKIVTDLKPSTADAKTPEGALRSLLSGDSALVPLEPKPADAAAAAAPPDPAIEKAFLELKQLVLAETADDKSPDQKKRNALIAALGQADGRVLDKLRADPVVSLRLAALSTAGHANFAAMSDSVFQLEKAVREVQGTDLLGQQYTLVKTFLEQRPDPVAAKPGVDSPALAIRSRVLQSNALSALITRFSATQQRDISRLVARGTMTKQPIDDFHEAAETGNSAEALKAAVGIAGTTGFAALQADPVFRKSLDAPAMKLPTATTDGIKTTVYDFVQRAWGVVPNATADAESALPQTAVNPIEDKPLDDNEWKTLNGLFPNTVTKLDSELREIYTDNADIITIFTEFENTCADHKLLFQRAKMHPGVELTKRANEKVKGGSVRNLLTKHVGEAARQVAERVLGMRIDAATVGNIGGDVHLADDKTDTLLNAENGKGKVPLAQALREIKIDKGQGTTLAMHIQTAAQEIAVELDSWRIGSHKTPLLDKWWTYEAKVKACHDELVTATTLDPKKLDPIEFLVNAFQTVPDGGDLAGKIAGTLKPAETTEALGYMRLTASAIADRNKKPIPPDVDKHKKSADRMFTTLTAALVLQDGHASKDKLAAAGIVWDELRKPDPQAPAAAAPGAAPAAPGAGTFAEFYTRAYGIDPHRHVVEVARAAHTMFDYNKNATDTRIAQIAALLKIGEGEIRAEVKAPTEQSKDLPNGFLAKTANEIADKIWAELHAGGDVVKIRMQIDGKRPEEREQIKVAFRAKSGGIDLSFYTQQAAQLAKSGGTTIGAGGDGVHGENDPTGSQLKQSSDPSSWTEMSDIAKSGKVGVETRVRVALANGNKNEIFHVADEATPADRKAILGNTPLMGEIRAALRQVDFDRVFAVLTGTADLAVRLLSRSEGDVSGGISRFFSSTDTKGMQADIKEYAARRKEFHIRAAEKAGKNPKECEAEITASVKADLLKAYDNPDCKGIIESECSLLFRFGAPQLNTEGQALKGQLLNGGEADNTTKILSDEFEWSGDVLAQLRTLTVVQRQTYRKDPEFLRRLTATVTQPIKNKLCFLALLSDEAPGEDHIGRLWEISTEVFSGDHKAQVASLSAGEYLRLRADPDMLARVTQPLPPELQKTVRELAGLDTAKAALSIGAHEVPGPKGSDGKDVVGPDGKPKSSELYTLGDKVPGQITKAEVDRLGFLKLSTIQRLQLGAAKSWEALLRQAVEVYKLDLKPALQAPAPSAEPPAPGATPAGPDAAALAKAAKDHEHTTRAAIWAAVKDVVLPVAKDGKAPQEGAKYDNESAIEHAVMKDPNGDPSSLLFNFSIGAVWNDHDDIDKTIKGASDDIVLNQWSSVTQQKFFGSGGESFKYRYDALKLARSEQAQQAQGAPNLAAKKKLDDETLKFQRYVIEPSQFFEKMLLPGAGGDTKQTDHAGQALERSSENYSKYRKAMNERIKGLDQGMVATTIGATGADAQMVGSALRGALQNFSITQEGYADARRDGHGWAGQDEGRELDRAFGDYKQEINNAEDGTVGADQKTGAAKDLSPEEARKLAGLDQRVNDRKEDFTTARNEAASIAATVVSVLIGVLLTALLPGAGSLVAMAMYGALVGAAAATGEVITKAAIIGASNYDITDQGARTILTGAATGMIAAGSQFYAGKIMNGLAKAGSVAAQGENLVGAAAAKVPRWQQVLAAGGKAGTTAAVTTGISGLTTAAGSALDPKIWVHGWDEGWSRAMDKFLTDLKGVPGGMLRSFVTAGVGGAVGNAVHGEGGPQSGDPLKPGEQIGANRVLTQIKNDFPSNAATAVTDASIGNMLKENNSIKSAAGQAGANLAGSVRDVGLGLHDGSVRYVEQQLQAHHNDFASNAEREMYLKAAASAPSGSVPSAAEFIAAREMGARSNPGVKDLPPADQQRFVKWVREAPTHEEGKIRAARNPAEVLASLGAVVKPTGKVADAVAHVTVADGHRQALADAAGRAIATEDAFHALKAPHTPEQVKQATTAIENEITAGAVKLESLRAAVEQTQKVLASAHDGTNGNSADVQEIAKQYLAAKDALKSGEASLTLLKLTLGAVKSSDTDVVKLRAKADEIYSKMAADKTKGPEAAQKAKDDFLKLHGLGPDAPLPEGAKDDGKKADDKTPGDDGKHTDPKATVATPEVSAKRDLLHGTLKRLENGSYEAPREDMPTQLGEMQKLGGVIKVAGSDDQGRKLYQVTYPDGTMANIVESITKNRPGLTSEPTKAEAEANAKLAKQAEIIQQKRDQQLTDLAKSKGAIFVDRAILGAGQAGVMDMATLKGNTNVPGVDITAIPSVINIAPAGSMFAAHGDFSIGQPPTELGGPSLTRQPGEFATNHSDRTKSADFCNALTMTGFETGMVTFKGMAESVEFNPHDGSWPAEFKDAKMRIKSGGVDIYTNAIDGAMGLGPPRKLGRSGKLVEVDANGQTGESKLLASGKLVHAQQNLHLPNHANQVAVVGDGATGAWACEAAIKRGAKVVYWFGGGVKDVAASAEVHAELSALGLTADQVNTYYRAYNERNAGVFKLIKEGKVKLVNGFGDASLVEAADSPHVGQVKVSSASGEIHVDGVVSAIGSAPELPKGMKKGEIFFKLNMHNNPDGSQRLVSLIGVDKAGKPNGIEFKGPQMVAAGIKDMVVASEQKAYDDFLDKQTNLDPTVPKGSKGVPGSIYQTGVNTNLANNGNLSGLKQPAPGPVAPAPVTVTPADKDKPSP